jgi:hypothetical protein
VFTARYALSPYIKQIRFVFKGLSTLHLVDGLPPPSSGEIKNELSYNVTPPIRPHDVDRDNLTLLPVTYSFLFCEIGVWYAVF